MKKKTKLIQKKYNPEDIECIQNTLSNFVDGLKLHVLLSKEQFTAADMKQLFDRLKKINYPVSLNN